MALSFTVLPSKILEPTYSPFYFVANSALNASGNTNFKFVFKIQQLNQPALTLGSTLATIKLSARPSGDVVFSPARVLENIVSYDSANFFSTGFTNTPNSIGFYKITFGEEYTVEDGHLSYSSVTNNGGFCQFNFNSNPSFQIGDLLTIDKVNKFVNPDYDGQQYVTSISATTGIVTTKAFGFNSSESGECIYRLTYNTGNTFSGSVINFAKQYLEKNKNFIIENVLGSTSAKFLNDFPSEINILTDDVYVLSAFQSANTANGAVIITYDSNGVTNGLYSLSKSASPYQRFDLGVGTYNLSRSSAFNTINSTVQPIYNSSVAKYSVVLVSGGTAINQPMTFNVHSCNNDYNYYRLAFLNRRGGFSFFNFNMKRKRKLNIDRSFISKPLSYNYSIGDVQEFGINYQTEEQLILNTDWVTQTEGDYLEELFTSPVIFYVNNELMEYYPFVITSKEYEQKLQENEPLIQYQIEGRFAYNLNLQRN